MKPAHRMDILFAGAGEFGLPTLRELVAAGHRIVQVYSQPDRPAGRGKHLTPTPVSAFCLEHELPLLRTPDINAEPLAAAELLIVIAFGQKIAEHVVVHPRLGSVNLHASLLPRWRGAAPINHAILAGDPESGNSIIRLAQRMDAGAVLAQWSTPIGPLETAGELHDRLAEVGAPLMLQAIEDLASGRAQEAPQDEAQATRALKISRDATRLDFTRDADALARQIRGLFPWPGCRVRLLDRHDRERARLTIARARRVSDADALVSEAATGRTGEASAPLAGIGRNGLVRCGTGTLEIIEVLPEGKRVMSLAAFHNGHPWEPGMRLEPL